MLIFKWRAYKFKQCMDKGYHLNLKDICKIVAVFIFALDVLHFVLMTRILGCA